MNVKRVERLWRVEGLRVPPRRGPQGQKSLGGDQNSAWALPALRPAHIRSYDFVTVRKLNEKAPVRRQRRHRGLRLPPSKSQNLFTSTRHSDEMTTEFDRDAVIAQVTDKLAEKYGKVPRARIEDVVREEVDTLADRPVHDYVSVLGERAAKKRLKEEFGDRRS